MRIRIILLALIVHQCWTHPSFGETDSDTNKAKHQHHQTQSQQSQPQKDSPDRDGESSKRIIGSSVVTSVSVILNGNEPEFTDALGVKVPKPQVPHLQVASPINLLNPDRYEFYTFDDNGELVKRLMTMQEIQSIVANGDGEGPTIIHSAPINERDPEKNVQDIVKSVQNVLNREVESNKNTSDIQPILDTPDVSSSWSMILPAIFGNTGGDIFPQNKPQQVVMTPDSDVFEATTKSNKNKPTAKPKPQKKKNGNRRKTTTKRISTTTAIPDLEAEAAEVYDSTTRKVFINNQEVVQSTEMMGDFELSEDLAKRHPVAHARPASTKRPHGSKLKNRTKRPSTTSSAVVTSPEPATSTEPIKPIPESTTTTEKTEVTPMEPELTTLSPTTIPATPSSTTIAPPVVVEENENKEKPPHKKRKKPTRKPSTSDSDIEGTTEKHFSHYHRRKQTTARPYVNEQQVPQHSHNKVPTTTTQSSTTITTTELPTTSTTPVPSTSSTTTTTTTQIPTSSATTTTTPEPETTTTSKPIHHHPHTTQKPITTPDPTTTSTTPIPTTTTKKHPTILSTFATYRPTPPTTATETLPTYLPPSTSTTSYHHTTPTTKKPFYAPPNYIEQEHVDDYLISSDNFSPSLKKEKISLPGQLSEKEQDHNTKISFDQILQSLKEETSTDDMMEASESEEVQMPARLPPNNEHILETESPVTMTSMNLESFKKEEEFDLPASAAEDLSENKEEEGPVVVITGRPQIHTSNKPLVPLVYIASDTTTAFEEPQRTTLSIEDQTEATTLDEDKATLKEEGSANVVKFEPLFADIQEPIVTTFTTTELPQTTSNYDFSTTNEDESDWTTLPPMDNIMQKIDDIIAMSLQSNQSTIVEANTSQNQQALPHISALTMSDFKTQAATMASILEDHNTSEYSETTPSNSIETKDEIELLLSDVINQMTQSQPKPTLPAPAVVATTSTSTTTTLPNNIIRKQEEEADEPKPLTNQDETAQRLSNFAQINPALHLSVTEIKESSLRQPMVNESIKIVTSASKNTDDQPHDDGETTLTPDVEQESNYVLISQGNDDYPVALENSDIDSLQEEVKKVEKETTTPQAGESLESEKDHPSSLGAKLDQDVIAMKNENLQITTISTSDTAEEEKSTEIPGETTVVFTDSDMELSYEPSEHTTIVPSRLQMESHLLHGEDPYIKLGEIGAKPTVQSLAQLIYEQHYETTEPSEEYQSLVNPLKMKNEYPLGETALKSEEDTLRTSAEDVVEKVVESSMEKKEELKISEKNEQVDQPLPTIQSVIEDSTNTESELPQLLTASVSEEAPVFPEEPVPLSTLAPLTTVSTKKPPNTLKPVSYFNKQPALNMMNDQKFNAFQAAQQRPVVRPASLSNLKMPQSGATRLPVKLDPSPADSKGLEASTLNLDEDLQQFSQLCNELAFTYWRSITSEKISSARSLVISPFALTSMLSMVFLGARGSTSGEMNEVLKLDDMVTFNPHLVFKNVTESVERATDSDISSSAFVREAFSDRANGKILQFFKEKTQQFYSGHVEEVNFHVVNDVIRRRTNLLVKRHTMGKVMEYLRTNSVWVNGPLATISANLFQTDCSRASFTDRDGEMFFQVHPSIRQRRLVPIPAVLFRTGFTAGYEPNLDATVVAFGRYFETVSTIYVMPGQHGTLAPADSLDHLESNLMENALTKDAWRSLLTSLIERPGLEVQLPRFSHRSFVNASLGLQKMGLKGLFNSELADLRGLTGLAAKDIYLSDMIQINTFSTCAEDKIGEHHHVEMYPAPPIRKRNKDVRENEDAESDSSESAIDFGSIVQDTGMGRAFYDDLLDPKFLELPLPLRPRQARIPDAPRLRFDRPFLYFVRHNPTGMILFMGRFNPRLLP